MFTKNKRWMLVRCKRKENKTNKQKNPVKFCYVFFFLLIPSWKIFNNMFPTINKNSKQLTSRGWLVWLKWQWKEQSSKEKVVMFSKFQKACWNTYDKTLLYFIFHPLLSPVGLSDDVYVLFQLYCLQLPYFWFLAFHFATPQCPENKFQVTCTSVEEGSAFPLSYTFPSRPSPPGCIPLNAKEWPCSHLWTPPQT